MSSLYKTQSLAAHLRHLFYRVKSNGDGLDRAAPVADPAFYPATHNMQPATRISFLLQITVMPFFKSFNFGNQLFLLLRCQRLV